MTSPIFPMPFGGIDRTVIFPNNKMFSRGVALLTGGIYRVQKSCGHRHNIAVQSGMGIIHTTETGAACLAAAGLGTPLEVEK